MAKAAEVLGCRLCLICCSVKRTLLSVHLLFEKWVYYHILLYKISILREWLVIHHQRSGDISLLTLQEIKKKKGFGLLEWVHLLQECANYSFQVDILTKGNRTPSRHMNVSRNLTFFINQISSISLQLQYRATYSTDRPCFLFYDNFSDTDSHTPNIIIVKALMDFLLVGKKTLQGQGFFPHKKTLGVGVISLNQ